MTDRASANQIGRPWAIAVQTNCRCRRCRSARSKPAHCFSSVCCPSIFYSNQQDCLYLYLELANLTDQLCHRCWCRQVSANLTVPLVPVRSCSLAFATRIAPFAEAPTHQQESAIPIVQLVQARKNQLESAIPIARLVQARKSPPVVANQIVPLLAAIAAAVA